MPDRNPFETQFLNALRDIFVGARVEGDSGFINLMKIKARYYEQGVFPQLQRDINTALQPFPDFREELFDKLYTFFQRYFSESGSIYFRYTALHQNVYEKVYTDDRDVILFWKTHMLYYVKTDRIFTSLNVEVDGVKFFFDASKMTLKKANEKREVVYAFRSLGEDGTLVFDVTYSEKGKTTKVDDILKEIKKANGKVDDETLNKAFRVFEKQSEVDFFINKDARSFLREQFDLWMYQYLFAGQNTWSAERLAQLQVLKEIAFKIIDFISQFEDELVKIWNKPKFVRNSHYVLTLDHVIASPAGGEEIASGTERPRNDLFARLLAHPNLPQQVQEWRDLGMLGDDFRLEMLTQKDLTGAPLHPQYQYLPIDTKYFPDLELEILALFDDLDAALDGWLVHSENYQALNTLLPKFQEHVNCIYIDPPYNTAASEIIYQNQYKHSSWLSLLDDRIKLSYEYMTENAIICVAIDDFEYSSLKKIIEIIFGSENNLSTVVIRSNPHGRAMAAGFSQNHEYAIFFSKTSEAIVGRIPRDEKKQGRYSEQDEYGSFAWMNLRKTGVGSNRVERPRLYYPIYVSSEGIVRVPSLIWSEQLGEWQPIDKAMNGENVVFPVDENGNQRVWNMGWERAQKEASQNLLGKLQGGNWQIFRKYRPNEEGALPNTWWDDAKYSATESGTNIIRALFGSREIFSYPKSIFLVEDCLLASNCSDNAFTIDFFAGSGTTAHAVMNLNRADGGRRKYILVEMGEHFNTVILPRIKKVAFSDKWKDGKASGGTGMSHFVKYYDLESYEDVLRRARYADADLFNNPYDDPYHSYVFLRDLKLLEALDVDVEHNAVHLHPERLYPDIDLAETLSQRRGKWIKRITAEYVEFQDGERLSLLEPDWEVLKPLIWWQ